MLRTLLWLLPKYSVDGPKNQLPFLFYLADRHCRSPAESDWGSMRSSVHAPHAMWWHAREYSGFSSKTTSDNETQVLLSNVGMLTSSLTWKYVSLAHLSLLKNHVTLRFDWKLSSLLNRSFRFQQGISHTKNYEMKSVEITAVAGVLTDVFDLKPN